MILIECINTRFFKLLRHTKFLKQGRLYAKGWFQRLLHLIHFSEWCE